jgi:tight adherence protein B
MLLAALVFVVTAGFVLGGYAAAVKLPPMLEKRRLERRLKEVSEPAPIEASSDSTVVKNYVPGPVPAIDRAIAGSRAGNALTVLIEQSGVRTTASGVVLMSIGCAMLFGVCALLFVPLPVVALGAAGVGMWVPVLWLMRCRSVRLRRFEEQFPEGLDLMSRAIRAGHAFQTALGMVGEELPAPVGSEFKKTFDRQNFGLPLRDAMNEMADRIPILDVRFFVTAVAIQRETGGNLAEILDNLAHVVRERFKIRRQVRVHTAHGRFTGYVLLALPAALAVALSFIAPETMALLFRERMGQMMLVGAMGMQTIGFFWIRQVIKIEV